MAATKQSFVQIVAQTNAFPKMDIQNKPPTFTDASEQTVSFLKKRLLLLTDLSFTHLFLNLPMVVELFRGQADHIF